MSAISTSVSAKPTLLTYKYMIFIEESRGSRQYGFNKRMDADQKFDEVLANYIANGRDISITVEAAPWLRHFRVEFNTTTGEWVYHRPRWFRVYTHYIKIGNHKQLSL